MKILIVNSGRIGDLIISTSVLPVLKSAFPDSQIGFLASSTTEELVRDHIFVDWVHLYDHPRVNPRVISQNQKKKEAKKSWRRAFREIKEIGYDHAVDLHTYSRDHAGPLLFLADIPRRSAYWRCPHPFFFNDLLFCGDAHFNLVDNYGEMLREMGVDESHLKHLKPTLEFKNQPLSPLLDTLPRPFLLIHMGTSDPYREWDHNKWKKLLAKLESFGYPFVFAGKGLKEKRKIEDVMNTLKCGINFCDKLTLRELMEVVKRARLVIGVESMAGHLASAFEVPGVFIYSGQSVVSLWRPYSKSCELVLAENFDYDHYCAPFELLQNITPEQVFDKVRVLLGK